MANVAALLKQGGFDVSGSDSEIYEPAASILRSAGIVPSTPYRAENLPADGTPIIIGNAHSRGHVEVEKALNEGFPMYSFPEFLHRNVLAQRNPIVVAGTHGKSTTTACIAHLLREAGRESGLLVGAQPLNFPVGALWGREGESFVIEGDEYDSAFFDKRSKFLHYYPRTLVLGTVEYDHADIFATLEEMLLSFRRLLRIVPQNGTIVFYRNCQVTYDLVASVTCRKIAVGTDDSCDWRLIDDPTLLVFADPGGKRHVVDFQIPGRHNRLNALMSIAVASCNEIDIHEILSEIRSFRGLKRRLERIHETNDLIVYDDFGHHPTAIKETLTAMRETYPGRHLIAVVEPRSNTMVRNVFQSELVKALGIADEIVLGTIHRADRIPAEVRLDPIRLSEDIKAKGNKFYKLENHEIADFLVKHLHPNSVIIFLSNGDFDGVPHWFVNMIKNK